MKLDTFCPAAPFCVDFFSGIARGLMRAHVDHLLQTLFLFKRVLVGKRKTPPKFTDIIREIVGCFIWLSIDLYLGLDLKVDLIF